MALPELEELVIRENHISQLPALPETMTLIDASHNNIGTKGIHNEAFKVCTASITGFFNCAGIYRHETIMISMFSLCLQDMTSLLYLYLTDNHVDYIPVPLPDSLRSLHLQVHLLRPHISSATGEH